MVGNHRDGWVYGALDPLSSTAANLEVSRAITSVMKSTNWRPRRTIVFCNWGAEEHGLVGSFEFTEVFQCYNIFDRQLEIGMFCLHQAA